MKRLINPMMELMAPLITPEIRPQPFDAAVLSAPQTVSQASPMASQMVIAPVESGTMIESHTALMPFQMPPMTNDTPAQTVSHAVCMPPHIARATVWSGVKTKSHAARIRPQYPFRTAKRPFHTLSHMSVTPSQMVSTTSFNGVKTKSQTADYPPRPDLHGCARYRPRPRPTCPPTPFHTARAADPGAEARWRSRRPGWRSMRARGEPS